MICFIKRIIIANIFILLLQTLLLMFFSFYQQKNSLMADLFIHLIFTTNNKTILFLNPPLIILAYYIYLLSIKKYRNLTLILSVISVLNFIVLYFISWIEMLMLIAKDK